MGSCSDFSQRKYPAEYASEPSLGKKSFAQQELAQPIARSTLILFCILPTAQKIAQPLMRLIGNPHRSQISTAQKVSELLCIAPIRLHSIA